VCDALWTLKVGGRLDGESDPGMRGGGEIAEGRSCGAPRPACSAVSAVQGRAMQGRAMQGRAGQRSAMQAPACICAPAGAPGLYGL